MADEQHPEMPTEFSRARESDSCKYLHGIGIAKMSIPDTYQDSSVLAANRDLRTNRADNLSPANMLVDIATETGVMNPNCRSLFHECWNRSLARFVKKRLGLVKFACV